MKPSLQRRMLIAVVIGMAAILALFNGVLFISIRNSLLQQIKQNLSTTAQMLAASTEIDPEGFNLEIALDQLPDFNDPQRPLWFQIRDVKGEIVAQSPNLDPQGTDLPQTQSGQSVFTDCRVGDHPAYVLTFQFLPRIEDIGTEAGMASVVTKPYALAVARESGTFLKQLHMLRWIMTLVSIAALFLSLAVAWLVVRQGLRPLRTVASQIAAISTANLSTRVREDDTPTELVPVTERLNDLLDRLQKAFKRERQFTADVAHELRTPLAGLRSVLEVSLLKSREAHDYQNALTECTAIATGMQTMVENLLTLARLEARCIDLKTETFALSLLVDRCWQPFASQTEERGITWTCRIPTDLTITTDPNYLEMVLTNLLSNAADYTNADGQITVTVLQGQDQFKLRVTNTGCTLTPDQVEHVFDCFWRADTARTATGQHCGLGLALVRRIVETLGGSAYAEAKDGVFTVQIESQYGNEKIDLN